VVIRSRALYYLRVNYQKHYNALIDRAKNRTLTGYFERHHVIPRCIGGGEAPENIVRLTPEEHYLAHQLLVKINPGKRGLVFALLAMSMNVRGLRPNNKQFGWVKRRVAAAIGDQRRGVPRDRAMMEKVWASVRGRIAPDHERKKISAGLRGKRKTAEHNSKVSVALMGRPSPMRGRTHSEETKRKIRDAALLRRHSPETIAKLTNVAARQTQEQRSARAHKAWRTKRAKKEEPCPN
jgi:hypothetical protein